VNISVDNKIIVKYVGAIILSAGMILGSHSTYRHIVPEEKHTQTVQMVQIKRNDAGHPTWVLVRPNKELFVMEFDNDVPTVGQGVNFKDIIYVDHGPYRHLVKILFY
jgi:hypothetical protein